jgi:hypothetical protein
MECGLDFEESYAAEIGGTLIWVKPALRRARPRRARHKCFAGNRLIAAAALVLVLGAFWLAP